MIRSLSRLPIGSQLFKKKGIPFQVKDVLLKMVSVTKKLLIIKNGKLCPIIRERPSNSNTLKSRDKDLIQPNLGLDNKIKIINRASRKRKE